MKRTMKKCVAGIIIALATVFAARSGALAAGVRVDLILDNGSVLIYNAQSVGMKEGQTLGVIHNGQQVGTIQVTKVTPHYAQAKIVTGAGSIQELDLLAVSGAGSAGSGEKKATETGGAAQQPKATEEIKSGSSGGTVEKISGGTSESSSGTTTKSSSSRRRGGSASSSSSSGDETAAATPDSGSSRRSSRRGGGTSSEEKTEEPAATAVAAPAASGQAQQKLEKPYYSFHTGYFFLKEDVSGTVLENKPALMFSLDLTKPRRNNVNYLYSITYARPTMTINYAGQNQRYQFRFTEFSLGYIWNDLGGGGKVESGSKTYGGFSAGYRNATSQVNCGVSCNGTSHLYKKSEEGMDYHAILGLRFREKMDFRLNYCLDEKYYTVDIGYRY
jgi:hypothetical protein